MPVSKTVPNLRSGSTTSIVARDADILAGTYTGTLRVGRVEATFNVDAAGVMTLNRGLVRFTLANGHMDDRDATDREQAALADAAPEMWAWVADRARHARRFALLRKAAELEAEACDEDDLTKAARLRAAAA